MTVFTVRHERSEANIYGGPAFGKPDVPLTERGRIGAVHLGPIFAIDLGINLTETPVATSTYVRPQETAVLAGAKILRSYHLLDEIEGLTLEEKGLIRETGILPKLVMTESEKTLENPPQESVWFTHGLRLAGICKHLGVYQEFVRRPYPRYGEIRELPIDTV